MKNKIIKFLSVIISLIFLYGCDEIKVNNIKDIYLYACTGKPTDPSKRKLVYLGTLDKGIIPGFNDFLKASDKEYLGYIYCKYYLELIDNNGKKVRRIGVVISKEKFIGLDITTKNPENAYITSTHEVLVCSNRNIADSLFQEISKLIRKHEVEL